MKDNVSSPPLRTLDLFAGFACSNCGKCCQTAWTIAVERTKREQIENLLRTDGMPDAEINRHFKIVQATTPDGKTIETDACATDENKACLFLGREGEKTYCTLQRKHGVENIPSVCQTFPRFVSNTPGVRFLSLSLTCHTAAECLNRPNALRETTSAAAAAADLDWKPSFDSRLVKTPPAFLPGTPPPEWDAYAYFWRWAVEWMARPDFSPSEALYLLGFAVDTVERNAATARDLEQLADLLGQMSKIDPTELLKISSTVPSSTETGMLYFNTFLNVSHRAGNTPPILQGICEMLAGGAGSADWRLLSNEYDRQIRHLLTDVEVIERNFLACYLFPSGLIFSPRRIRTAYFTIVLSLILLRFTVLILAARRGISATPALWLEAASVVDDAVRHNPARMNKLLELIEPFMEGNINDLAIPALF